jgi:ABC-type nitrate/sulfonate/bicarbonate transport system permease component
MNVKAWFRPFEQISKNQTFTISIIWIVMIVGYWFINAMGDKHLFPTPAQVWDGLKALYNEGLVVHIGSSLKLCLISAALSIVISLTIVYLSPLPFIQPVANFLSRLRYLPLTGITFYLSILVTEARKMQIWVLVVFMSLYFITSMLAVLKDISADEINHARSLKCSRWEILWEVVIKGRLDYVIDVLRQNLAIVWMMLVTVESILVAAGGLGVLIKNSDKFANHGRIVALQIIILLIGLLLDWVLQTTRKGLFRYSTY